MLPSILYLTAGILVCFGFLVFVSLAVLDLLDAHGLTAKGKLKRADMFR
jgi:hypothetical protein